MKRIMTGCLAIMVLLLAFQFSVNASVNDIMELDVYEDSSEFDEINAKLEEHGREIMALQNPNSRYIVKLLDVTRLVQADARWKDEYMEHLHKKIGLKGCCLTSFTMIRNHLSGMSDTPDAINDVLGNFACPFDYSVAAAKYNYEIVMNNRVEEGSFDNEKAIATIIGALDTYNRPVLVGMVAPDTTHFVVACGYNSANGILIRDPASDNCTLLSEYLDNGYGVNRIYCFDTK